MSVPTTNVQTNVIKEYYVQDASNCTICKGAFLGINKNRWATVTKEITHPTIRFNIKFSAHVDCLNQMENSLSHPFDLKNTEVVVLRPNELEAIRLSEKNVLSLTNAVSNETSKLSLIKDLFSSCLWTSSLLSLGCLTLGSLNIATNSCNSFSMRYHYLSVSAIGALTEGILLKLKLPSYKSWVIAASSLYFALRYTIPSPIFCLLLD